MSTDDYNPFAAPESGMDLVPQGATSDEALRLQHIECEQNIRSIAQLMIVGSPMIACAAVFLAFFGGFNSDVGLGILVAVLGFIFTVVHVSVGVGLHRLRPWSRPWAIFISAIWLLVVPFGTVIAAGAIAVHARPVAGFVLTEDYKEIIARTPHIVHKTSIPA